MILYALLLFLIAAAIGLFLASRVLRGQFAPWGATLTHGALAAVGLVLLVIMFFEGAAGGWFLGGLTALVLTALGGFFLASFHFRKKLPPHAIVFLHAALGLVGFGMLLAVAIGV